MFAIDPSIPCHSERPDQVICILTCTDYNPVQTSGDLTYRQFHNARKQADGGPEYYEIPYLGGVTVWHMSRTLSRLSLLQLADREAGTVADHDEWRNRIDQYEPAITSL